MPYVVGFWELTELREQRVQVTAEFHAARLVRFEDLTHLIDEIGLALHQRLDQFLRHLILADNSIHVSPNSNQSY